MRLQSQNEMQLLLSGKTPKHCYVFGHYTGQGDDAYILAKGTDGTAFYKGKQTLPSA